MSYKRLEYKRTSGILFCLVGPTGAGKTTLGADLLKTLKGIGRSISATTRLPRAEEQEGISYFFMSEKEFFKKREQNEFFETEQVHGNWYGTPKKSVTQALEDGTDLLLTIDLRGALNFKRLLPAQTVLIFILPPAVPNLVQRIYSRSKIPEEELQRRLATTKEELELLLGKEVQNAIDYLVHNEIYAEALESVLGIVRSERLRKSRLQLYQI